METWKWIARYSNRDIPVGLWSSNEPHGDDICVEWNTKLDGLKPVPCTERRGYMCRILMFWLITRPFMQVTSGYWNYKASFPVIHRKNWFAASTCRHLIKKNSPLDASPRNELQTSFCYDWKRGLTLLSDWTISFRYSICNDL